MKICQNCGHENKESGKFCSKCGAKLSEIPRFCPECGTELEEGAAFCSECGYNLSIESTDENDNYGSDLYGSAIGIVEEDDEYEEYINEDEYKDDEPIEDKIRKIVDKYIPSINKGYTWYKSSAVQDQKYSQVFQNVRSKIATDVKNSEILGYIDTSVVGKGKAGLLFTTTALYEGAPGSSWKVPYYKMTSIRYNGKKIVFNNTDDCGIGWMAKGMDIYIDKTYYNIPALKDCLDEILAIL